MLKYLPITASELPVSKIFTLGNQDIEFVFRKNERAGFITLELKKEGVLIQTQKICYGHSLF
ncbi:MAG TPA: hypothetical protein PL169_26830, partial [Leptospiraceae bacterium]|nr:hypothetical protein [Leptospiraceae bacterium]